jgi:RNA polymerase sigma-70 factor, ECF subfamily
MRCKLSQAATYWSNLTHTNVSRAAIAGNFTTKQRHLRRVTAINAASNSHDGHFDKLVRDCNQRVYRLALRITRNHQDAEDARQETFLKVYRHLDQFEGRSRFTTWISRIAINEGLMNLRKRNDSRRVPLDDIAEIAAESETVIQFRRPTEDPEVSFARRQLRGALEAAIGSLRPLYRDVFVLRAVDELSTSETAKALGLTVSTVKTRLRRARMELRIYLESCGQMVQNAGTLGRATSSEAYSGD